MGGERRPEIAKTQAEFQSKREYVTDIVSGVCPTHVNCWRSIG